MADIKTISEYIATFPRDVQEVLHDLKKTIKEELPEAEEGISYKIPVFKIDGHFVLYFAAFKKHISIYPFTKEVGEAIKESSEYKTSGKGTIQFPIDKPLPMPLIRKIVKYMYKEHQARWGKK